MKAKRKVLVLGNGINRIDNQYSWEQLMTELLAFAGMEGAISPQGKPFPMLYEEVFLRWNEAGDKREMDLKRKIKQLLRKIRYNDLHKQVMELPVDEILTTNYDYNLEATLEGGIRSAPYIPPVKGSKYSMHRKRVANDKFIWHIHGEVNAPGSILLGYEQYAGYLQHIRHYMVLGKDYKDLRMPPLNARLKEEDDRIFSWVDHFFLSDIFIMGLSMDFVEMHLWWILDFRARLMADKRFRIDNEIVFIYPSADQNWIKPRIDLMCACGVKCVQAPVEHYDWKAMYRNSLKMIANMARSKPDVHG